MTETSRLGAFKSWFREWIYESLALPFYLIIHPSAWRKFLNKLDPDLPPDFTALHPTGGLWRVMLKAFIVLPLLLVLLISLFRLAVGANPLDILGQSVQAATYAFFGGFALAGLVNMAAGIVFSFSMAAVMSAIPTDGNFYFLPMAVTAGLVARTLLNLDRSTSMRRRSRSAEGVAIGAVILVAILGFALLVVSGEIINHATVLRIGLVLDWPSASLLAVQSALAVFGLYTLTFWLRYPAKKAAFLLGVFPGSLLGLAYLGILKIPTEFVISWLLAGIAGGLFYAVLFGLTWNLAYRVGGSLAGLLVGMLGMGLGWLPLAPHIVKGFQPGPDKLILTLATLALVFSHSWWRPLILYPVISMVNWILFQTDRKRLMRGLPSRLRGNSAFWDEAQFIPASWLEEHLLLVVEYQPAEVNQALQDLSQTHQRWAAREIQLELIARRLESAVDVQEIGQARFHLVGGELTGPASAMLRSFSLISHDVAAALNQVSPYQIRMSLGWTQQRLNNLERDLRMQPQNFAMRFVPIVAIWRNGINAYLDSLVVSALPDDALHNPYVCGAPLDEAQEIFVGRTELIARICKHLQTRTSVPLFIHGQRRMGKTSLLLNLRKALPVNMMMIFIDCQTTIGLRTYTDILYTMILQARKQLDLHYGLTVPEFSKQDSVSIYEWLEQIRRLYLNSSREWLLVLDEFEALRATLAQARLDPVYLLNILRHVMQHYTAFKVIISGSLFLEESPLLAGYLVGMKTMRLGILYPRDVQKLIEQPVANFGLKYETAAVERMMFLTRGHPHLTQQLCFEVVELKNTQPANRRRLVVRADVEEALQRVFVSATFFFFDLENNQMSPEGRKLLRNLALRGENAVFNRASCLGQEDVVEHLVQRELLESVQGGYRFKYELVRLWFEMHSNQITRPLRSAMR